MKPETADYLAKARHCLANARIIATADVSDIAAREAYLAAYHAAEAYIFEHTGKAAKTHRGLRSQFGNLARQEPGIGGEFLKFLAEGYKVKEIADYGIGPAIGTISSGDAAAAIDMACKFIHIIARLLSEESVDPGERAY